MSAPDLHSRATIVLIDYGDGSEQDMPPGAVFVDTLGTKQELPTGTPPDEARAWVNATPEGHVRTAWYRLDQCAYGEKRWHLIASTPSGAS